LLRRLGATAAAESGFGEPTPAIERAAMQAVIAAERALGFEPRDVSDQNFGYDIESHHPKSGLRFIEVKGRFDGAETVTVTQNEIRCALNNPDSFILAVVSVSDGFAHQPRYIRQPFRREPDFGVASVTYKLSELLTRGTRPC
jgi:Domain of unknown function (DUF3883)